MNAIAVKTKHHNMDRPKDERNIPYIPHPQTDTNSSQAKSLTDTTFELHYFGRSFDGENDTPYYVRGYN